MSVRMRAQIVAICQQPADDRAVRRVAIEIAGEKERSRHRVPPQDVPYHLAAVGILMSTEDQVERMLPRILPDKRPVIIQTTILSNKGERKQKWYRGDADAQTKQSAGERNHSREASQYEHELAESPGWQNLSDG